MYRRYGEPVKSGQRYTRRAGVYAVLLRGDCVLVTFQQSPKPEFQLPGGGIDAGEQPIAALHREVMEETGWRIRITRRVGTFRRFTWMPEYAIWAEKVCTVCLAQPVRRIGPATEAGHTAVWLPIDEAARLLASEGDRAMLLLAWSGHAAPA